MQSKFLAMIATIFLPMTSVAVSPPNNGDQGVKPTVAHYICRPYLLFQPSSLKMTGLILDSGRSMPRRAATGPHLRHPTRPILSFLVMVSFLL